MALPFRLEDTLGVLGRGVTAGMGAYRSEKERQQAEAAARAKAFRERVGSLTEARMGAEANQLLPRLWDAEEQATPGLGGLPRPRLVGAARGPGLPNDFNNPQTLGAIRGSAGLDQLERPKAPELMRLGPGEVAFDPVTRRPAFTAPNRPNPALTFEQRMSIEEARQRAALQRAQLGANTQTLNTQMRLSAPPAPGRAPEDRTAKELAQAQTAWERSAQAYVTQELAQAENRAKAKAEAAAPQAQLPPAPPPGAPPEQLRAWEAAYMEARLAQVKPKGPAMGLSQQERDQLRVNLLRQYQDRNPRPGDGNFRAPGQTAPGPLRP